MSHVEPSTIPVAEEALKAFDAINGPQSGYRPAHAKGILLAGSFTPAPAAKSLTRAPHILRASTPVSVRFSDFAGIPAIPDNHEQASPRGFALRFHLEEHSHTDIIAHSIDGFPARTAEEFVEFLHAIAASGPNAAKPTPVEKFLGSHPAALRFVQTPQPMPVSFAKQAYFAVNAYKFTNREGSSQFGRYRIRPDGPTEHLDAAAAQKATPNFLFDEITGRLQKGPVKMRIAAQVAGQGDIVDDSTSHWQDDRPEIEFGTIELKTVIPNNDEEQRQIIFDPIPRVDGIESSGDPLLEPRATVYLYSGRRRRAAVPEKVPAAAGSAR
ncbi:MAG TPA: catalase family peroxidase [Bryobacteraceae bacterium]|nr:catalase family peroxidase [Bryobacteraceae bacterium]